MTAALAPPSRRPGRTHPAATRNVGAEPIEIFAPDRSSTELLIEYAARSFRAELAPGFVWIVRLHPPAGDGWTVELHSLLQRWLESARLPWANVLYRGRSHLIRASGGVDELLQLN